MGKFFVLGWDSCLLRALDSRAEISIPGYMDGWVRISNRVLSVGSDSCPRNPLIVLGESLDFFFLCSVLVVDKRQGSSFSVFRYKIDVNARLKH